MTATPPTARPASDVHRAYFAAWTAGDLDTAMALVADDVVCHAPAGRLEGIDAFRGFMGPFSQIVTGASIVAAFGDEDRAVMVYDCDTVPVADAPGGEAVVVRGGKIAEMRIVFDRLPFAQARGEA